MAPKTLGRSNSANQEPGSQSGSTAQPAQPYIVSCPNCGRELHIPRGKGVIGIGCKGCRHVFHCNRATGQLREVGSIQTQQAEGLNKTRRIRLFSIIFSLLLLLGIGVWWYFTNKDAGQNHLDAAPQSMLEEIGSALKAIAE